MSRSLKWINPPRDELVVLKILFVPLEFRRRVSTSKTAQRHLIEQVSSGKIENDGDGLLDKVRPSWNPLYIFHYHAVLESSHFSVQ